MSWSNDWRRIRAIAAKDLTAERRSKASINAVTFLGVLVLMLFGFALGPDAEATKEIAAGAIWLAILFSGVLAFNRCYQLELDGGALDALLLYPGSRWPLFVGKLLANIIFVLIVEVVVLPAALVLFHVTPTSNWYALVGVTLLGTLGFVTLGTFYAAMSSRSRSREVLLPLLLFPMMIPLLLAAVQASMALQQGDPMREAGAWIRLLVAFDVIFVAAAVAAFEYVIEI